MAGKLTRTRFDLSVNSRRHVLYGADQTQQMRPKRSNIPLRDEVQTFELWKPVQPISTFMTGEILGIIRLNSVKA